MPRPISERKRQKFTGRGKGHSFLRLPHYLIDSEEFGALSTKATKMLVEIARKYRPGKNGDISVPWSILQQRGWLSEWTAKNACQELVEAGFILVTRHGIKRMCSLYAVTWEPIDDCPGKMLEIGATIAAPNTWRKSKPNCCDSSKEPPFTAATAVKAG